MSETETGKEQIMTKTFFKKNLSARFTVCLVLFIPLIVAVIHGLLVDPNAVTANNLRTVEISVPEGNTYEFTSEKVLDLYSSLTENAKKIDESFRDFSSETPHKITFNENNAKITYSFYASTTPEDCVCVTPDGTYYLVSKEIAQKIIKREEFASIDTERLLPALTLSALEKDISVTPDSFEWTYTALDGNVYKVKDEEKAENPVIKFDKSTDGKLSLSFDREPDSLHLEIADGDNMLFNDKYEKLPEAKTLVFDHDQKLSLKVTAEWYEIDGADHFGSAEYNLSLLYDIEPEYSILNKSLPTGEFTVLKFTNFNDGELAYVESDLELPEEMKVYDYKDYKIALVPLTSNLEAKDYEIKLSTQLGQSSAVKINIARREEYDTQTLLVSEQNDPGLSEAFSQAALDEFDALVKKYTNESENKQLFEGKNFEYPTGSSKIVSGGAKYGMEREVFSLNSDGIKYVSFGQDMECIASQALKAANTGKVVYAGKTTLLGNTVIIDHGFGILSYYGNLESISVETGDEVSKGATVIGKAGSTGFACTLSGVSAKTSVLCHYAVSMNGAFIAPKSIYSGIYLS